MFKVTKKEVHLGVCVGGCNAHVKNVSIVQENKRTSKAGPKYHIKSALSLNGMEARVG